MRIWPLLPALLIALGACEPPPPEGPTIRVDREGLAFGGDLGNAVYVGTTKTNTLVIVNDGLADLQLTAVTQAGSSAFHIRDWTAEPIPYREFGYVRVEFSPPEPGEYGGDLVITSNAVNEPSLTMPMSGTGVAPP